MHTGGDHESVWSHVRAARTSLADLSESLDPGQWDTKSLCEGWRVRDVVAHLVGNAEGAFVARRAIAGLLRHGMNVDAFLFADALRRGASPPVELVHRLRAASGGRFQPPGRKPADVLADVLVHSQDIVRPLGLELHAPADALRAALTHAAPQKAAPVRARAAGLTLRASDIDWQYGSGPCVDGSAEDLLLTLCGRTAAVDRLSGDGVAVIAGRCSARSPAR